MRALKYLLPLWTSIAVYSVLSLFYGAMGFTAYNQLLSGRDVQWENIKDLGIINSELENAQNNLLYDRDVVAMYAQSLGYGRDDGRFIRIVGLGSEKNPYATCGEIVLSPIPGFIPDKIIKICAFFAGMAVFVVLFVFSMLRRQ